MKHSSFKDQQRGVILIVAMILAVVSGIAVASYLRLSKTSMQLSNRSFYSNAAVNLAETGLEQAMWSINQKIANNTDAWADWATSPDGTKKIRTFVGDDYGQNTTGSVLVAVENYAGGMVAPVIYSRATIKPATGALVEKWLRVDLTKRGLWANGLVAKDKIIFNGNNVAIDSWNSDPLKTNANIPYGAGVRRDQGTVASAAIYVNSVLVNNADIWGYAATGGAQPVVGNNGSILGADSAAAGYSKVDPRRVSTDFTADFTVHTYTGAVTSTLAAVTGNTTLSTSGAYNMPSIDLKSSSVLTIKEHTNVILIISGDINVVGNGSIKVETGASLTIYTAGDAKIAGNGLVNLNAPKNFMLFGTKTATPYQDIKIAGNGYLSAAVYAPFSSVAMDGGGTNGQVEGAVVADNITMVGNSNFHYDEALADLDTGNPYGIKLWDELSSADERTAAATHMN